MVLHLLFAAPSTAAYSECITALSHDDAVLLLGDGVYSAIANSSALEKLIDTGATLYALDQHCTMAGIEIASISVNKVDMTGFVELSEQYPVSLSWY